MRGTRVSGTGLSCYVGPRVIFYAATWPSQPPAAHPLDILSSVSSLLNKKRKAQSVALSVSRFANQDYIHVPSSTIPDHSSQSGGSRVSNFMNCIAIFSQGTFSYRGQCIVGAL